MIGVILLAGIYLATDAELWDQAWVGISLLLLFVIAGLGATRPAQGRGGARGDRRRRRRGGLRERARHRPAVDADHARAGRVRALPDDHQAGLKPELRVGLPVPTSGGVSVSL
jgi:hypothetical protein